LIHKLFIACLRHENAENAECGCCDGSKEEETRVEVKLLHDRSGNRLAESGANANRRADGPEGEIEATAERS
jgi:hypothetical protein